MKLLIPVLAAAYLIPSALAQDWKDSLRFTEMGPEILDAPNGYRVLSAPAAGAEVIDTVAGPAEVQMDRWIEVGESRYYLTPEQSEKIWDGREPTWIEIAGTERARFIQNTIPPQLIKRETRDFFKTGEQTAEIYEETVSLTPLTQWGPGYRRAEIDFRLPVRVASFRVNPDDSWEVTLAVYPAFDSNTNRIPGKRPENWGEPYEALITRPREREIRLSGPSQGERWGSLLMVDTIWAAAISEGRIQGLRIGYHELQAPFEVSRLSAPVISSEEKMKFRFATNRLLADPAIFEVTPDRIIGLDITFYDMMAAFGGPKADPDEAAMEALIQQQWQMTLSPDLNVSVVVPVMEGRGAAGMLELESLGLGPTFEEELKALAAMKEVNGPLPLPPAEDGGWNSILTRPLGEVPSAQRGPETQF